MFGWRLQGGAGWGTAAGAVRALSTGSRDENVGGLGGSGRLSVEALAGSTRNPVRSSEGLGAERLSGHLHRSGLRTEGARATAGESQAKDEAVDTPHQ